MSEALENLRNHQTQLDADGCMVGVSRQALEETFALIETMQERIAALEARNEKLTRVAIKAAFYCFKPDETMCSEFELVEALVDAGYMNGQRDE